MKTIFIFSQILSTSENIVVVEKTFGEIIIICTSPLQTSFIIFGISRGFSLIEKIHKKVKRVYTKPKDITLVQLQDGIFCRSEPIRNKNNTKSQWEQTHACKWNRRKCGKQAVASIEANKQKTSRCLIILKTRGIVQKI